MSAEGGGPLDRQRAVDELRGMFDRLRASGRPDAALCVALGGEHVLGEDSPPEVLAFGAQYKPPRPRRATVPLDPKSCLELLAHPEENPYLSALFASVAEAVRSARVVPLKHLGFDPARGVHPAHSTAAVARVIEHAAYALAVPAPLLFLAADRPGGFAHLPSDPLASLVGSSVLGGLGAEAVHFLAGSHLAWYRPALYVAALYQWKVPALTALVRAVVGATHPALVTEAAARRDAQALRTLLESQGKLEPVTAVVDLLLARTEELDVARWVSGAQRTAFRAGLLLAGDIRAVSELLRSTSETPAGVLGDLSTWALSEEYFVLRQRMGLALWADAPEGSVELAPPSVQEEAVPVVDVEVDAEVTGEAPAASEPALPEGASKHERWVAARYRDRTWEAWCLAQSMVRAGDDAVDFEVHSWLATEASRVHEGVEPWERLRRCAELLAKGADAEPLARLAVKLEPALRRSRARAVGVYDWQGGLGTRGEETVLELVRAAADAMSLDEVRVHAAEPGGPVLRSPPCEPPVVLLDEGALLGVEPVAARFAVVEHVARLSAAGALLRWLPTDAMRGACMLELWRWARTGNDEALLDARQWAAWDAQDLVAIREAFEALGVQDEAALEEALRGYGRARQRDALRLAWVAAPDWEAAHFACEMPRWPALDPGALQELEGWSESPECLALLSAS